MVWWDILTIKTIPADSADGECVCVLLGPLCCPVHDRSAGIWRGKYIVSRVC